MFDRDEMTDEETRRAGELMQRLFAEKCIVPMKDAASKADFEFICRHRAYFEELMARCGFELYIVSAQGKEVAGFRALSPRNRMRLKKKMSLTILYLRYRYEEAAASVSRALAGEQEVTVSVSELLGDVIADKKSGYALHFERDILAHNVNILNIRALEYTGYVAHVCDMKSYFDENLKLIDEKNLNALFPKESPVYTKIRDDNPVRYVNGSSVSNSLLADGCVIEGTVENCVLFRGVRVKKGAVVRNCVLMQDTVVEPGAQLDCVVTDKNVRVTADKKLSGTESFPVYVQKNHTV